MKFSLLTYNLLFNRASDNIGEILSTYHPGIVCLQETVTQESNLKIIEQFGYKLANYSNSFIRRGRIFGVTTFFDPKVFSFTDSQSFNLSRSFYEFLRFIANNESQKRTVLKTDFFLTKTKKKIAIYNLHLASLATNNVRDKHIRNTFEDMHLAKSDPVVIAGDFNYPYGRRKFESMLEKYGLKEATNNLYFTLETKILKVFSVKLKLDYILYKNVKLLSTEKIQVRHSDHFPIISYFEV